MPFFDEKFLEKPDTKVDAKAVFGVDFAGGVPAFSKANEYVPAVDPAYRFDPQTTRA
ncbi:MAG TPA: cobaltochelatase subunit CobS, partial [Parvularcula sp.]|nr:cobaltochelatase subunit CobS [Parvularcula sp.]